jgi:tetraacyldisaccharide 4'-kinase
MKYLRWLLFPFSLVYGLVVIIRNWCFDSGVFKSERFNKSVIAVGNLDVGGAGKSPMTEYLVRLLKDRYKIATLSRGYGRKTTGYLIADVGRKPLSDQVGDEPSQFKHKFPDVTVAVCESRVDGIMKLLDDHEAILLDDAFQHRAVEPGLSILLFDFNRINEPHLLLPAGNMREPFSGRWRAQVIIVSKCPETLNFTETTALAQQIAPLPYQKLFYTAITYQALADLAGNKVGIKIDGGTTVFLLTGIANAKPLVNYISGLTSHIIHHNYPDHHPFTLKNIAKLAADFAASPSQKKIIITTEKDAQRLEGSWFDADKGKNERLPVFVIPIRVKFLNEGGEEFDQLIIDYVREHSADN